MFLQFIYSVSRRIFLQPYYVWIVRERTNLDRINRNSDSCIKFLPVHTWIVKLQSYTAQMKLKNYTLRVPIFMFVKTWNVRNKICTVQVCRFQVFISTLNSIISFKKKSFHLVLLRQFFGERRLKYVALKRKISKYGRKINYT